MSDPTSLRLPTDLAERIDARIEAGAYQNRTDFLVRAAERLLDLDGPAARTAANPRLLPVPFLLDSGSGLPTTREDFESRTQEGLAAGKLLHDLLGSAGLICLSPGPERHRIVKRLILGPHPEGTLIGLYYVWRGGTRDVAVSDLFAGALPGILPLEGPNPLENWATYGHPNPPRFRREITLTPGMVTTVNVHNRGVEEDALAWFQLYALLRTA